MKYSEAVNVEELDRLVPEGGSGTGYAQYRVFKITYNDNRSVKICITDWYTDKKTTSK